MYTYILHTVTTMASEMTPDDEGEETPTLEAPASEVLAALTGRPASEFQPPEDVAYPHPEELESVDCE